MTAPLPMWVQRVGLVLAIVLVYVVAIRPARVAFVGSVALPLFSNGSAVRSGEITLTPDATVVLATGEGVDERDGEGEALFKTPLGDRPMAGVLALAFLFPRRRWWLVLAGTALAEGVITTVCFAAGANGIAGAFVGHRVAQAVLNDTLPMAMPALIFLLGRSGYLANPAEPLPSITTAELGGLEPVAGVGAAPAEIDQGRDVATPSV